MVHFENIIFPCILHNIIDLQIQFYKVLTPSEELHKKERMQMV